MAEALRNRVGSVGCEHDCGTEEAARSSALGKFYLPE